MASGCFSGSSETSTNDGLPPHHLDAGPAAPPDLSKVRSFANSYADHSPDQIRELGRYDVIVIDPDSESNIGAVCALREKGTIVLAYVDIAEAEEQRDYFRQLDRSLILAPNPEWPGVYLADVNNTAWRDLIVNRYIPTLLAKGKFDGLCLDMLDAVDMYLKKDLKPGMIQLINEIRQKYPDLLLVPNRGFSILPEIAANIDAIKYEEMSSRYDFYTKQYVKEENQAEMEILLATLKKKPMPVLVLDHVQTIPQDETMAQEDYERARHLSRETGFNFVWYANSVDQDLPEWPFLELRNL